MDTPDRPIQNPFREVLVTELLESPDLYRELFSPKILIAEALDVFKHSNVVVTGPQGSGKSMLLNLLRYPFVGKWLADKAVGLPPGFESPFLGLSINLVRSHVQIFGRRSAAERMTGKKDEWLDAVCAGDFLATSVLLEFLRALEFMGTNEGDGLRSWLGLSLDPTFDKEILHFARSPVWSGYYTEVQSRTEFRVRAQERLDTWRGFLNANLDSVPESVWRTKAEMNQVTHEIGNLLRTLSQASPPPPLMLVIDQYEELPNLNPSYGSQLQRLVNSLIKARDPVVFVRVGARTHDWGRELRVLGSDSRIELQRDYKLVDMAEILIRREEGQKWVFPRLALDVATRRIKARYPGWTGNDTKGLFGKWQAEREANDYLPEPKRRKVLVPNAPELAHAVLQWTQTEGVLDVRLASAWVSSQEKKHVPAADILREGQTHPWLHVWWRKERISVALLQIASFANQRKRWFGWDQVVGLAGSNISAFVFLCGSVWDEAARRDPRFLEKEILPQTQTLGIRKASVTWKERDESDERSGGARRADALNRLGAALKNLVLLDPAISNPGHSGFSLSETDGDGSLTREHSDRLHGFLDDAVSWASLEQRTHTSKEKGGGIRRKWYLHPLLSPAFGLPIVRVKEPKYVRPEVLFECLFGTSPPSLGRLGPERVNTRETPRVRV
ncbi:MAG: hypothetical protein ABI672_12860 [Vicinamibacteria bacterium]